MNPPLVRSTDEEIGAAVPDNAILDDPAADELRQGLQNSPRVIPPRWLYDDRGSSLFDAITRLPGHDPTESERWILSRWAGRIAELTDAHTLVELGAGAGDTTRTLLHALVCHGTVRRFAPVDASRETLVVAEAELRSQFPGVDIEPVVGDVSRGLHRLPEGAPRLVALLGGTIGNFHEEQRRAFLGALVDVLLPGDALLVGIDLTKPIERLLCADDEDCAVTELFVRNSLVHINREFEGNIDVGNFCYVPPWDRRQQRIDLRLRTLERERARLPRLGLELDLEAGEELRVQISTEFHLDTFVTELTTSGLDVIGRFGDAEGDCALLLATLPQRGPALSSGPAE